jgi:hypothetical protein
MSAPPHTTSHVDRLHRLRWAVRAALTLGLAASVAANVLHARPNPISQIIAAWPPLALLLTVELISRVPHHRWHLGAIRITAAAVIATIAGWVSYWHLVGVATRYGETHYGAAYLLPISVDGLVTVASVSLVEITARIRAATREPAIPKDSPAAAIPTAAADSPPQPNATTGPSAPTRSTDTTPSSGPTHSTVTAAPTTRPKPPRSGTNRRQPTTRKRPHTGASAPDPIQQPLLPARASSSPAHSADAPQPPTANDGEHKPAASSATASADGAPAGTAAAVAYWRRRDPTLHPAEIASRIGRSERTVRRHWSAATNGPRPPEHTSPQLFPHRSDGPDRLDES